MRKRLAGIIKGFIITGLHALLFLLACNTGENKKQCRVTLEINNAYNQKIYLETIPAVGEEERKIDSADIRERVESVVFIIKEEEERLYQIRSADSRLKVEFIADTRAITIKADYFEPRNFSFRHSPASVQLVDFLTKIEKTAEQNRAEEKDKPGDSLPKLHMLQQQRSYYHFVDTVSSPAAALYIFNNLDFGKEYDSLDRFIRKLHARFAGHSQWERFYQDTQRYLSIFSEELQIGDQLPDLILPDAKGAFLPLSFYKGKYLLIDFWASWDNRGLTQVMSNKKAYERFGHKNFNIISIALDPEKETWQKAIEQLQYTWPQFIDENVWTGVAVNTFKFDSIPFNFLADPGGKIIGKALYGDSLLIKLEQLIR